MEDFRSGRAPRAIREATQQALLEEASEKMDAIVRDAAFLRQLDEIVHNAVDCQTPVIDITEIDLVGRFYEIYREIAQARVEADTTLSGLIRHRYFSDAEEALPCVKGG